MLLLLSPAIGCLIHPDNHDYGERHAPLCGDGSSPVVRAEERSLAFTDRGRSVLRSGPFLLEGIHVPLDHDLLSAFGWSAYRAFRYEMSSDRATRLPLVALRL
jgi:hypothetical protein